MEVILKNQAKDRSIKQKTSFKLVLKKRKVKSLNFFQKNKTAKKAIPANKTLVKNICLKMQRLNFRSYIICIMVVFRKSK